MVEKLNYKMLLFISQKSHLVQGGLLADKDEEDEASAEEIDAPDGPENKLGG